MMDTCEHNKKDISKVFAFLRAQLQTKEKELLELQRVNPCLLAPDSDQIGMVVDAIASLELSTQEGSFVFASTSVYDDALLCTYDCSTGLNSIKTLPSSVWLAQSNPVKQKNEQQSFIFSHLLSLPINAYLASSSPFFGTTAKTQNQSLNRIPMINPLLFMPIDTFKASSKISMSTTLKDNKNVQNNVSSTSEKPKSILNSEVIFSKEYWLQDNQNVSSTADKISCRT
ncbi:unnamed protein product [Rotaria sordida]|uniref:Uncharacterized protein n=1 Tax=Rotaria sordida TaxID=392033 RepID=A0A814MY99_9BILA|nr:unnamed protein product [Rotaria sordida]CAF1273653.1 unnamed protein product [Rotaria sordida]